MGTVSCAPTDGNDDSEAGESSDVWLNGDVGEWFDVDGESSLSIDSISLLVSVVSSSSSHMESLRGRKVLGSAANSSSIVVISCIIALSFERSMEECQSIGGVNKVQVEWNKAP